MYSLWLFVRYFRRLGELAPDMPLRARARAASELVELMTS